MAVFKAHEWITPTLNSTHAFKSQKRIRILRKTKHIHSVHFPILLKQLGKYFARETVNDLLFIMLVSMLTYFIMQVSIYSLLSRARLSWSRYIGKDKVSRTRYGKGAKRCKGLHHLSITVWAYMLTTWWYDNVNCVLFFRMTGRSRYLATSGRSWTCLALATRASTSPNTRIYRLRPAATAYRTLLPA